jgi:hypothetical protein
VIGNNYFQACTLQNPNNMDAISQCIQDSMNRYYSGQQWESAVLGSSCSYSIYVTAINQCLVQQKPFAASQWDYYAWRVQ